MSHVREQFRSVLIRPTCTLVSQAEQVGKLKATVAARSDPTTVIIVPTRQSYARAGMVKSYCLRATPSRRE
jgi:hypothetical protein